MAGFTVYKATNYAEEFCKSWCKNGRVEVHYIYQDTSKKVKTWLSYNPGKYILWIENAFPR